MFKENSMLSFDNPSDFMRFYEELNIYGVWKIHTGSLNQRGDMIKDRAYVNKLRICFSQKKLFRRNVSIAEIVSWLDSYYLIKNVLNLLKQHLCDETEYSKLEIYCEYKIEFSKDRRIDYILKYKEKLLLIEFRLSDHFPNLSNIWQKKELELIIYKELLTNYISKDLKVFLYAFIAMPEYDNGRLIPKHVKYNKDNIDYFCRYISKYIFNKG